MNPSVPVVRDVVLVGGGHTHALAIRAFGMRPIPGVRLTLVSRDALTPYSGMLPGLVAGHYTHAEAHIDLWRLCSRAGVRFLVGEARDLDLQAHRVRLEGRPAVEADLLSIDIGSTPSLAVPGAAEHAVAVKPVSSFDTRWRAIVERARRADATLDIGVIGSGAGGFELVMSMRHALHRSRVRLHWFLRDARPLPERPGSVSARALAAAHRAGLTVHTHFDVSAVESDGVVAADGRCVALDEIVWCTGASPPAWIRQSGLATDADGFVAVDAALRSRSHDWVFAAGDIATMTDSPVPKAGVFAVRQAPVLVANLRRALLRRPLRHYRPQRRFLALLGTGGRHAIASRGRWSAEGRWVWRWKDFIDRRFMRRFETFRAESMDAGRRVPPVLLAGTRLDPADADPTAMRCRGCGAKIGASILEEVLGTLALSPAPAVLLGVPNRQRAAGTTPDVAVLDLAGQLLVQSVDQLRAPFDDPYRFGRLAALHALSDVYTRRAEPHSAQLIVELPFGADEPVRRDLAQAMTAVVEALEEAGCTLVGGHTAEASELAIGLVVNARQSAADFEAESRAGVRAGDAVILTQALGTGLLLAALGNGCVHGPDLETALAAMLTDNRRAADILRNAAAGRITDVTGFGLFGHARDLVAGSDCTIDFALDAIPALAGAAALAEAGLQTSLWRHNQRFLTAFPGVERASLARQRLFADPQTGGGLIATVPDAHADAVVLRLRDAGYERACRIGSVIGGARDPGRGRPG